MEVSYHRQTLPSFCPGGSNYFLGPYSCVGKQLALMELRRVLAEVFTRYDVSFAPGQTQAAFLESKKDAFTLVTGPLQLLFSRRQNKASA